MAVAVEFDLACAYDKHQNPSRILDVN